MPGDPGIQQNVAGPGIEPRYRPLIRR
jgi:hypothetical protein